MRVGYDAVDWTAIPSDAAFVLGYVDGNWPWPQAAWDYFESKSIPAAKICVDTTTTADVLDCEQGNPVNPQVDPQDAVPWVQAMRALDKSPTLYCSASNVGLFTAPFNDAGVALPNFDVADWTGESHAWSNGTVTVLSTQWNGTTAATGYDNNLVVDYWPGVDPEPLPSPVTVITPEEDLMQIDPLSQNPNGQAFALTGQAKMGLVADGFGSSTALRFAFWVNNNVSVEVFTVGAAQHSLGHTLPSGCTGVTVTREDNENIPVGISFFS